MWPNETAICTASANSASRAADRILDRNQFIDSRRRARARPALPDSQPMTPAKRKQQTKQTIYQTELRRFFDHSRTSLRLK